MNRYQDKIYGGERRGLLILALVLGLGLLPILVGESAYTQYLATRVAVGIVLTLGLNLFFGYLGQINFGYHGFYCLGAYAFALLIVRFGFSFVPAVLLTLLAVFAAGFLIGLPLLRLSGHFLALGTLAMGLAIYVLSNSFPDINGGEDGMVLSTQTIFGITLKGTPLLYFLLFWVLASFYICHSLISSRIGRAIIAIREDEQAASACGINVFWFKLIIFALSASFGAIGGIIWVTSIRFIQPELFNLSVMILLLSQMVVGGLGSNLGAVLGGAGVILLQEYTAAAEAYQPLFFAGILMAALIFFPTGLIGLFKKLFVKTSY